MCARITGCEVALLVGMRTGRGGMAKTKKRSKSAGLRNLKAKAWKLFSEYVRRKHADSDGVATCYTSGVRAHWKNLQCGHAIGGRHNAVLFDEEICRPQSVAENIYKRGNYPVFTTKLIEENGFEWWKEKLEGSKRVVKFSRAELEELIEHFQQKIVEINNANTFNR